MPQEAVEAVIRELDPNPSLHVRPSDVDLGMRCRRKRVWESRNDHGVDPLQEEDKLEGTALHDKLGTHEIEVPERVYSRELDADNNQIVYEERLDVCGVPMRGRIDWLYPDLIKDLKTAKPYFIPKFPTKEEKAAGARTETVIWEPKGDGDARKWCIQLSIYRVLLEKSGQPAPTKGRVWRRYGGVKGEKGRYKRFDFNLLDEAGLEREIGPWVRSLQEGLTSGDWKSMPPDGREFQGREGLWLCNRCPARRECDAESNWASF